jgi:hypothetical protein
MAGERRRWVEIEYWGCEGKRMWGGEMEKKEERELWMWV